jgi:hypothetical protein
MCVHKVLPALETAAAQAEGGAAHLVVKPALEIGSKLTEAELKEILLPRLVAWFGSPQKALRASLIENMHQFVDLLDQKTVRARPGRFSDLSVFHSESVLYGAFAWARRALTAENGGFRPGQVSERIWPQLAPSFTDEASPRPRRPPRARQLH